MKTDGTHADTDGTRPGHVEYTYHIDDRDVITAVDNNWLRFAEENDTQNLKRQHVEGRSIWDFVDGQETAQLYTLLFEKARRTGSSYDIPFRCDSPTRRRFMRLLITSDERGHIHFTSVLIREEEQPFQDILVPRQSDPDVLVRMCSWCKRVALPEGRWLDVEEAMVSLRIFETSLRPGITHGLCHDCRDAMLEQWESRKDV